jgi:hypothetical protein
MKEIFKELIIDFHASSILLPIKRNIALPVLPQEVRKALVFVNFSI